MGLSWKEYRGSGLGFHDFLKPFIISLQLLSCFLKFRILLLLQQH